MNEENKDFDKQLNDEKEVVFDDSDEKLEEDEFKESFDDDYDDSDDDADSDDYDDDSEEDLSEEYFKENPLKAIWIKLNEIEERLNEWKSMKFLVN